MLPSASATSFTGGLAIRGTGSGQAEATPSGTLARQFAARGTGSGQGEDPRTLSRQFAMRGLRRAQGDGLRQTIVWLARHWLALANGGLLVFASLPVLAPLLVAAGANPGGQAIYAGYSWVCHQLPSRSYFLFGEQLAYCQRNVAIYGSMAAAGLLWARFGRKLPRLSWPWFVALALPMAIDGFTQLVELRESTWQLRTLTGALFGVACVLFAYPRLNRHARFLRRLLRQPAPPSRRALAFA